MFDAIIIEENIRYGRLEMERKCDDRREFVEDVYLVDNVGDRRWITIVHVGVAIDSMQFGFTFQQRSTGDLDQIDQILFFVRMKLSMEIKLTLVENQRLLKCADE